MKTSCVRAQVWLIWCSARPANSLWKCPIRITRSVRCEQARPFCSCVNDFSGVADPVFTLKRGSGLQGQFTVSKQGLSAPVLMISLELRIPFLC
jgi:hypothetical protein